MRHLQETQASQFTHVHLYKFWRYHDLVDWGSSHNDNSITDDILACVSMQPNVLLEMWTCRGGGTQVSIRGASKETDTEHARKTPEHWDQSSQRTGCSFPTMYESRLASLLCGHNSLLNATAAVSTIQNTDTHTHSVTHVWTLFLPYVSWAVRSYANSRNCQQLAVEKWNPSVNVSPRNGVEFIYLK